MTNVIITVSVILECIAMRLEGVSGTRTSETDAHLMSLVVDLECVFMKLPYLLMEFVRRF